MANCSHTTVTIDGAVICNSCCQGEDGSFRISTPTRRTFSLYRSDSSLEDVESIQEAIERTVAEQGGSSTGRLTGDTLIVLEKRGGKVNDRKVYRVADFERALKEWIEIDEREGIL